MSRRGQLVLLAAVLLAVAFVPMVLAYLQLGYSADVRPAPTASDPTADARATFARAVATESGAVPGEFRWAERDDAVTAFRADLATTVASIEDGRVDRGVHRRVAYNATRARGWADTACPAGPGRDFGPCVAIDGVVVQERAGFTHVLAVAVDLETTGPDQRTRLTTVVRAVGDDGA